MGPAVPNPLALAVIMPLVAAWTALVAVLRVIDAALAMWLAEPACVDSRGAW